MLCGEVSFQRQKYVLNSVLQHWATARMIGGSGSDRGWKFFSSKFCPDRLRNPPSLLSNGYQGFLPWEKAAGA